MLCILPGSSARADTDLELVARIDGAVIKAVRFLASKQSPDGAWRSDVYAPFKEGDALTPLVMTALLPLPINDDTEAICERGQRYLVELSKRTFENEGGLKSLAYPVYTGANTTIAFHQNRRAEDEAIRAKWVQALRDLQLTEATGWKPEDVEYGGWSYSYTAPTRPEEGAQLATLGQPNLSATTFAMIALRTAGLTRTDSTVSRGLQFICGLQNVRVQQGNRVLVTTADADGGFFFIHADPVRNKAGKGGEGPEASFRSYGSATADGLRCLTTYANQWDADLGQRIGIARAWVEQHFSATHQPGEFPDDRIASRDGLYYYWVASIAQTLQQMGLSATFTRDGSTVQWAESLASELLKRQVTDGYWRNHAVDQREDEPFIATTFAISALTACRAVLVAKTRPEVAQASGGDLVCHARDVNSHGDKLRYEPQLQKNTVGYWVNEKDWASWQFNIEQPGEFEVIVWQGCGAGQRGSEVAVSDGNESVKFKVEDTGHFQHFKKRSVGKLKIKSAGTHELTLKCLHKAKDAVVDVRQIQLVPVDGKGPGRAVRE